MNAVDVANPPSPLVVVSGLSGSGKSVALRTLEDLDYYCVDNLPSALLPAFVRAVAHDSEGRHPRLAVGVDVRNRADDLNRLPEVLSELAEIGIDYELVFLDTRDDILIKRYSETRRRHPLSLGGLGLADAIALERKLMRQIATIADRVIDTSELNVHQLRRLVIAELGMSSGSLTLLFEILRLQEGRAAGRRFRFRCALPAQSALECRVAPAQRPRCAGARVAGAAGRCRPLPRQPAQFLRNLADPLPERRPQLRDHLHWLYRRPSSIGFPGRTPGRAFSPELSTSAELSS